MERCIDRGLWGVITAEIRFTFAEAFRANLVVVRWMPKLALTYAFLFLFGLAIFLWEVEAGQSVDFVDILPCLLLSISPLLFVAIAARRMSTYWRKHGDTVFQFDDDNILVTTGLYKSTIAWVAISKVRTTRGFIFLFTSTGAIPILPRRTLLPNDDPVFLVMASRRS